MELGASFPIFGPLHRPKTERSVLCEFQSKPYIVISLRCEFKVGSKLPQTIVSFFDLNVCKFTQVFNIIFFTLRNLDKTWWALLQMKNVEIMPSFPNIMVEYEKSCGRSILKIISCHSVKQAICSRSVAILSYPLLFNDLSKTLFHSFSLEKYVKQATSLILSPKRNSTSVQMDDQTPLGV